MFRFLAALLLSAFVLAQNTYIEGGIYQQIQAFGAVRMLNATGVTGPQTNPTVGVVYQILNTNDLNAFLAFSPTFVKFAVVLPYAMFTPSVIDSLRGSNKLAGLIVIENQGPNFPSPPTESPDDAFPNFQFSLYANSSTPPHAWNPSGSSMLYRSFDFPVFVMPVNLNDLSASQSVGTLLQTAKYNLDRGYTRYPLYSVEFNEFMWGAVDASTCLRRGTCSPVGASSVWGTFSYNISRKDTKNVVVVSSQLDGNGFFHDFVTGAATTASGYVTLLAVANALSQNQAAVTALPSDILFTLFSTEAFGFAGSQRFIQDISSPFQCLKSVDGSTTTSSCNYQGPFCANPCQPTGGFTNLDFNRISAVVELNQWSSRFGEVVHWKCEWYGEENWRDWNASNVNVKFGPATTSGKGLGLPPSSAMSFLAKKKIPAVVLGDFQTSFTNKYYNSIYDDASLFTSDNIAVMCGVATQTARSVFQLADDQVYNTNYPGIFTQSAFTSVPPYMVYNLLANYTAAKRVPGACVSNSNNPNDPNCGNDPTVNCVANQCVYSQTYPHYAYGLGIEMDYSTSKFVVVDAKKPTWVQSGYNSTQQRIRTFLSVSPQYQGMQIGVGLSLTLVATVATYYIQRFVDAKFNSK
ncbi:hypothetical protein BCR33DRAFT_733836 [Rhizoclosmatium globosum]|uniref:Nicastrin n=1 Tax=Rhizoclosmatium globosum TaxID=329046 RepID=A0A1Y2CX06_9FUNG|nr:hypothetical protein BCR33DRAFT_733836 [Rhizoclosmatium globosum]|eukprot:ORY51569.1 hypothetical protein BCR33DRAFT_733836 [Rhizoclosmatium globosum]